MLMSCTHEPEMATETFYGVYDILHPTPVSLEKLAVMAVSLEVWRCELNKHRTSDTLKEFRPSCESISLKTILSDLPSAIANFIEEYVRKFGLSIQNWLEVHYTKVFCFHYDSKTYILKKFDDFVCDYDGTVHHEKTAKRMMHSDRLSHAEKFKIACTQFYEDDIRRLWPAVRKYMNLSNIRFYQTPELYYWICCLRNKLEQVPRMNFSVDETMLQECVLNDTSRQSVQYFWDRIPPESRMRMAERCFYFGKESLVRFMLPKLDKEELAEFVSEKGVELMHSLFQHPKHDKTLALSTWMYIRNIMNVNEIIDLVVKMLQKEGNGWTGYHKENWLYLCCEILNNIPLDLKLTIIRIILSNNNNVLVESMNAASVSRGGVEILLHILLCVTVKERNAFWHHYWRVLIPGTRCENLKRIMDICFENKENIAEFKENITIENESVRGACVLLLGRCFFNELNGLVSFCYPDTRKAQRFKQQLLQSAFLGESCCFSIEFLRVSKEFNEFIDDAYGNANLSTDFKIQLMSSPIVQFRLSEYACEKVYKPLMKFIGMFVPKEQSTLMQQIKSCMINALKEDLLGNRYDIVLLYDSLYKRLLIKFVLWCLGSIDEVKKFQIECVSEFKQRHEMPS